MPTQILYLPIVKLDIFTQTNADWLDGLEYWDDQPPAGVPIDLAGISFAMEMRSAPPLATVGLRATTQNQLIRVYANSWQFIIPATAMILVPPGDYVFDLLGFADGFTRNLVQATVLVDQGITRSVIPSVTPSADVIPRTTVVRVNLPRVEGMPSPPMGTGVPA